MTDSGMGRGRADEKTGLAASQAPARTLGPIAFKEYYSIGEVCEITNLKPHVLRYWESQFRILNPSKNRAGNRAYRRKDIQLIQLVKHLLYTEKFTIEGARQKLEDIRRGKETGVELPSNEARVQELLRDLRRELEDVNHKIEAFRASRPERAERGRSLAGPQKRG
jgi:DNA-binding transcriptional MerR regulator